MYEIKVPPIFQKERDQIDCRNDDISGFEAAQESLLEKTKSPDPKIASIAFGLLSEIQYWKGETAHEHEKKMLYEKGAEMGMEGSKQNETCIHSHFWTAVNMGLLGLHKGILENLFMLDKLLHYSKKSLTLEETYFHGGPHRVMGYLYFKLPPWPISSGDNQKAIHHLTKALEYGPSFFLNHYYMAEVYMHIGKKDEARKHFQWMVDAEEDKRYFDSESRLKNEARKKLSILH